VSTLESNSNIELRHNNNSEIEQEVNLSISARVIYQLGEQLISDEFVALAELIKNAYDADCTRVTITVDTKTMTQYGRGRIIIDDNGNGMTKFLLINSFLRISTNFKKIVKFSPYFKRRSLGEKGLGRLSIQRLGNYVEVVTSPRIERIRSIISKEDVEFAKRYNVYNLSINWGQFLDSNQDISDVKAKCLYSYNENPRFGTKLIISGIRNLDFWNINRSMETRIRSEIFGMVNPFTQSSQQKFQINLNIDGKSFSNSKIDENVLSIMSDVKVEFSLENWILKITILTKKRFFDRFKESTIKYMISRGYKKWDVKKAYTDVKKEIIIDISKKSEFLKDYPFLKNVDILKKYDFNQVRELLNDLCKKSQEENKKQKIVRIRCKYATFNGRKVFKLSIKNFLANPGNFKGVLYVCEQSNEARQEAVRALYEADIVFKTLRELKAVWDAAVGVYLFRNDFRILPYGPDVDWLDFTNRSQRLKANSYKKHTVSGYIQLDSITCENLKEQTNRLGLIEDQYGTNFLVIVRDILAGILTYHDIQYRSFFDIGQINDKSDQVLTKDNNIVFYRVEELEEKKRDILTTIEDVTTKLADHSESTNIKQVAVEIRNNIEKLVDISIDEENKKKQDEFKYEQQIAYLKTLVGLAGQGIIVESLTHELHRIEQNISDYAKETKQLIASNVDFKNAGGIISNQEKILQEIDYLQQQLAHLEPTYRKNSILIEDVNIKDFLKDLYTGNNPMARKATEQNILVSIIGDDIYIKANKGVLITIFDNLFLNSLYWVNEDKREKKSIHFSLSNADNSVSIWDSGPGIHEDVENTLFEPDVSMKPEGRGLGLYIVTELLKSLHSSITLDIVQRNQYGRLYRFIIRFPME